GDAGMTVIGTFETCQLKLNMSVSWGRPEVSGRLPKRTFDPQRTFGRHLLNSERFWVCQSVPSAAGVGLMAILKSGLM
ncbi:hypothetical protein, partial [Bradyrhizobium sp. sGM-13]|uniref:hypothetical protein n=1 Tax=Bradyrhizobium sp. sGM-13 TaxID=2831781 RepID=UPI001BCBC254